MLLFRPVHHLAVLVALSALALSSGCGSSYLGADPGDFGVPDDIPIQPLAPVLVTQRSCPTAQDATAMATGDLNKDSRPDVVIASGLADSVSTYMNAGGTACPTARSYPTGKAPSAVAVAELNGDGYADVVVAGAGDNTVDVHLNQGNGGLGAATPYPVSGVSALAIGDVSGSGGDVVALSSTDDAARLLRNSGSGSFSVDMTRYTGGRLLFALTLGALVSGRTSLVLVSAAEDRLDILPANGSGGLNTGQMVPLPSAQSPVAVVAARLDEDTLTDLVVAGHGNDRVVVLLNRGDYTFTEQTIGVGRHPLALAVADLTHDGKPDIAVVNAGADSLQVLVNQGGGVFATDLEHVIPTAPLPVALSAVDVDGDGLLDLVTAHRTGQTLSIFFQR